MPHHVYTTRGIVLALKPSREADKVAAILTRDLGLIYAGARGVRKPGSKLTQNLLDLGLVKVSLVRGKNVWRVTTVTLLRDLASELRSRRLGIIALGRVFSLLLNLVRGEEKHPELFDLLESSALSLIDSKSEPEDWEIKTVAGVMAHLGYLDKACLGLPKAELIKSINQGLRESGLNNV